MSLKTTGVCLERPVDVGADCLSKIYNDCEVTMVFIWVVVIVLVILVGWVILAYNKLIKQNVRTNEAWSDIDVQLKRRYDLIPNLVSTVKGYAKQEKEILENVTKARAEAMSAKGPKDKAKGENQIQEALKSIFAVAENYPNLKSNENFAKLQDELSDTENKIQASRRFYNGNVRDINITIKSFPTNIIAGAFNFDARELFELSEAAAKEPVKVDFEKKSQPEADSVKDEDKETKK